MGTLKLTKLELSTINLLARREKLGMSEMGSELGLSSSSTSQVISSLREKNLVGVSRKGLTKTVFLSEAKHATLLRKLNLEFEHIQFARLLSGASLEVLSAICCLKLKNRREIQDNSLVSESSVANVLKSLKQIGLIWKNSAFHISPRFQTLKNFVREFRHLLNRNIALQFASDSLIVWECNHEFIIESNELKNENDFLLTGISTFSKFGVQLFVSKWYYFYSPFIKETKLEDAISHSLLINRETNLLPILLVWKKNDRKIDKEYLKKQSEKYGIKKYFDDIINYFETEGIKRATGFPSWIEFLDKAKEYGVS